MPFPTISSDKASFLWQFILKEEMYKRRFLNTVLPSAGILRSCPKSSLCKWRRHVLKCYNFLFTVTFILSIFDTWTFTYFQQWQFLVNFYLLGLLNFDLCTQITEPPLIPVLITFELVSVPTKQSLSIESEISLCTASKSFQLVLQNSRNNMKSFARMSFRPSCKYKEVFCTIWCSQNRIRWWTISRNP